MRSLGKLNSAWLLSLLLGVIVIALAIQLISVQAKLGDLERGAAEGFDVTGTYVDDLERQDYLMSFWDDAETGRLCWYARLQPGHEPEMEDTPVGSGRLERCDDPNMYRVVSESGDVLGTAVIAHGAESGREALYLVFVDGSACKLAKLLDVPARPL